jgi:hypothetical protein
VGRRLFAFSTVSGSSVAAVMTTAALAASVSGAAPCRSDTHALWFGTTGRNQLEDWRSCLEALVSGDFLTPVFAGLMFHDTVRFLRLADRGELLEKSWERQFRRLLGHERNPSTNCNQDADLECPFLTLRPTPERWLPLLVLNGTSVGSGQRILTSALEPTYQPADGVRCRHRFENGDCRIFLNADRFHDLLEAEETSSMNAGDEITIRDVRLSTAAHNSSRFPLISPPGEIYDRKGRVVDRLVDGGYFENFGAQTATELAEAVAAVDPRLKPFVLVLSNDPTVPRLQDADADRTRNERRRLLRSGEGAWVTDLSAPIKAFAHTRNARGTLAVNAMPAALESVNQLSCNVVQIRVWGEATGEMQARAISMSWWLSKPLQIYLHEQADFGEGVHAEGGSGSDRNRNGAAIALLLAALQSGHSAPTKPLVAEAKPSGPPRPDTCGAKAVERSARF